MRFGSQWSIKQGFVAAGLAALLGMSGQASAALYVYELPDGSRIVTDHAVNNKHYRLVRMGDGVKGMGQIVAGQNSQFLRADPTAYDHVIRNIATAHGVDFALVKAIMHVESSFNPFAKSQKGALGLMQLLPETAKSHGVEDIYDPVQNIKAGVRHIRHLSGVFKNKQSLVIAAYNAGEYAVKRHNGIPPYTETQLYVRKVLHFKRQYSLSS